MKVTQGSEIGDELKDSISIILLAAGSSSRMGQSKQLLLIDNEPLLLHSVKTALDSSVQNVIVVLGAEKEKHQSVIRHLPVQIIHNENWSHGMGSSIKAGLSRLVNKQPETQAVIIMVCDQPLLTSSHLNNLIATYQQTKKVIIASRYSNSHGVPALFDKSLFSELLNLHDEPGAKKVINKYSDVLAFIPFEGGEIDLDTWEEYQNFKGK